MARASRRHYGVYAAVGRDKAAQVCGSRRTFEGRSFGRGERKLGGWLSSAPLQGFDIKNDQWMISGRAARQHVIAYPNVIRRTKDGAVQTKRARTSLPAPIEQS